MSNDSHGLIRSEALEVPIRLPETRLATREVETLLREVDPETADRHLGDRCGG